MSLKSPTKNFSLIIISLLVKAILSHTTRSASINKRKHPPYSSNSNRHNYFHRLPCLWNALPEIDRDLNLKLSISAIKTKLKARQRTCGIIFGTFFNEDRHCTYHFICPCGSCYNFPECYNSNTYS